MKKTPQSHNSTLRKKKRINKVSDKQERDLALRIKIKTKLIIKYGNVCMICGFAPDWRGLELEHKIPLARGGKTNMRNCRNSCAKCHSKKHGIKEV